MNIVFWGLLILMLLVAIAVLVYPLLNARQQSMLAYKDSNLTINDEKIKELDEDLKEGRIDKAFYKAARDELDRELLIDIPDVTSENTSQHYVSAVRRHPTLALSISVFVPMVALLLYLELGMHAASEDDFIAGQQQVSTQQTEEMPSIEEMAKRLEARIEKDGGTVEDWTMLARAHKYLGQNELAAKAFKVALEQDENNAQLMLELAEVMALSKDRTFDDESRALVLKAYTLEPDNANVLWFAGVSEFQYGNYRQAIDHLLRLLPMAGGEEDILKSVVSIIGQSRQKLIDAGEDMPELEVMLAPAIEVARKNAAVREAAAQVAAAPVATSVADKTSPKTNNQGVARQVQVAVDVTDAVRQKFDANDIVFVYAKAKQGPRMPLAVQRVKLADLPVTVMLDDSVAMVEGMNMSAFPQLVISARVTKTGSAIAQSGDFIGQVDVSDENASSLQRITIENRVP